jgi:hypothetical protein
MRNRCRDIVENWTYIEDLAEFGGRRAALARWPKTNGRRVLLSIDSRMANLARLPPSAREPLRR